MRQVVHLHLQIIEKKLLQISGAMSPIPPDAVHDTRGALHGG